MPSASLMSSAAFIGAATPPHPPTTACDSTHKTIVAICRSHKPRTHLAEIALFSARTTLASAAGIWHSRVIGETNKQSLILDPPMVIVEGAAF